MASATTAAERSRARVRGAGDLPNVGRLHLGGNGIGDEGAAALAGALGRGALAHLAHLHLNVNRVGDGGAVALAEAVVGGALLRRITRAAIE